MGNRAINPALTLAMALIVAPTLAGLGVTLAAAFGYLPALGRAGFSLDPWRRLLAEPGLWASVRLTFGVGLASTAVALALALALLARKPPGGWALAALLASPHSAIAVGLAFLLAPSGWLARLFSPWATGWNAPPDLALVGDANGFALTLGLIVKETPFLLAVGAAALAQFPAEAQRRAARALGHGRGRAFALIVAPQLYRRIRLPVFAVLAYGLGNVDMALPLAPSHPAPLAVLALHWLLSPDLDDLFVGEAAAALQLGLTLVAALAWFGAEHGVGALGRALARSGARGGGFDAALAAGAWAGGAALALGFAALAGMILWAFAWRWPFPLALPQSWTLAIAMRESGRLAGPLATTAALGAATSLASLALAVAWLESEQRGGQRAPVGAVCLPLLAPQIAFLFGMQTVLASARLDGTLLAVAWAHMLFVFPYLLLALADPYRALDSRYARAAAALGVGPNAALWRIKLPLLRAPLALAFAIGFAVSAAQYLATLFAGGGRVATLTTEALALAGGGDRRMSALVGLSQTAAPFAVWLAALAAARR